MISGTLVFCGLPRQPSVKTILVIVLPGSLVNEVAAISKFVPPPTDGVNDSISFLLLISCHPEKLSAKQPTFIEISWSPDNSSRIG